MTRIKKKKTTNTFQSFKAVSETPFLQSENLLQRFLVDVFENVLLKIISDRDFTDWFWVMIQRERTCLLSNHIFPFSHHDSGNIRDSSRTNIQRRRCSSTSSATGGDMHSLFVYLQIQRVLKVSYILCFVCRVERGCVSPITDRKTRPGPFGFTPDLNPESPLTGPEDSTRFTASE